ncbi:hypothetical protein [Lysinibacillus sp. NPDC047702]|uniref:hypothetical protein n=1 Tax=unclassified Lysinibacillus TaxID=2636778 RepID=UPI003D080AD4
MLQGKCIDAGACTNLKVGEEYYLFPHGGLAYNVSRFPHTGAHFGTYQKSRFELVDAAMKVSTQIKSKYLARVVKPPSHFYRVGEEYVITEPKANGYYDVFLKSRPDVAPVGSYKNTSCFERIEHLGDSEASVVGDIVEIMDESLIRRKHYENGKQATVIENFYGCISIQLNKQPVDKKVIGSVLLVGSELQAIKKVVSDPVLKEADMANDMPKKVRKKTETVNEPGKKQKYEQLSLF